MDDEQQVVNPEVTTGDSEVVKPQESEQVVSEETSQSTQAGDKTDPNLLLKSLQEEREKRRVAESRLEEQQLNSSTTLPDEVFSDEGKLLQKNIHSLETELVALKNESAKKDLFIAYPVLKDKWNDFEDFHADSENKAMPIRTAAKAFLAEKGLLNTTKRVGLEKTTSGQRNPPTSGMTSDEAENLRKNNFSKYRELIIKGQLKVDGNA